MKRIVALFFSFFFVDETENLIQKHQLVPHGNSRGGGSKSKMYEEAAGGKALLKMVLREAGHPKHANTSYNIITCKH